MTYPRLSIRRLALLNAVIAGAMALVAIKVTAAQAVSTQVLRLSARSHMVLRFSIGQLHARSGRVTIVMSNPSDSGVKHGVAIAGHGAGEVVTPGHTASVSAKLAGGSYTFYCPVAGHRAFGMTGVLIIS